MEIACRSQSANNQPRMSFKKVVDGKTNKINVYEFKLFPLKKGGLMDFFHIPLFCLDVFETQIIQYSMFLGDDWKILRISNNYFLNNEEKSKALYRIVPFHSFISLFRACFR